ncbi:MAG: TolC family protein [Sulfurimonas sp.]
MRMLSFVFVPLLCFSAEFNDVFYKALELSPMLKAKEQSILASRQNLLGEATYKNPILSIGLNDMLLNSNFLRRDVESMQTQFIGITQEFETFGKLDLKEAILRADTLILEYELEDLRLDLYKKMALKVEEISTSNALLELLEQKKTNLSLLLKYSEQSINIADIFKVSVELQKKIFVIEDKILETKDKLEAYKNEFRYLSNQDYKLVERAKIEDDFLVDDIKKSPKYKIYEIKAKQLELTSKLEDRKKYSNVSLGVVYNNRQNHEDYLSVTASFALPIYGSEEAKVQKTRHLSSENTQKEQSYISNAMAVFDTNDKRVEYLKRRVKNLDDILYKYKELNRYDKSNITNSVTLEKNIENENLLLDLEIEKLKYNLDMKSALLELFYLTSGSLK